MAATGGAAGYATIVSDLLTTTFGGPRRTHHAVAPLDAAAGVTAFPWDEVMAMGLGLLRLSPKSSGR